MRDDAVNPRTHAERAICSYTPTGLRNLLGPAEAQYEVLTLGLEGAQGTLPCGSTVVDQSADDQNAAAGVVQAHFVWNDLAAETGYRVQMDIGSSSFVTEDLSYELAAGTTSKELDQGFGSGEISNTARVFAHVGHAPGHGATPIAGDVVSNTCTVTYQIPDV